MASVRIDGSDDVRLIAEIAGRPLVGSGAAYYLAPMLCSVLGCKSIAICIDVFAPYCMDLNRCRKHAPAPPEEPPAP